MVQYKSCHCTSISSCQQRLVRACALTRAEAHPFRRPRFRSLAVGKLRIHCENVYPFAALLSLWGSRLREVYHSLGGDANWRVVPIAPSRTFQVDSEAGTLVATSPGWRAARSLKGPIRCGRNSSNDVNVRLFDTITRRCLRSGRGWCCGVPPELCVDPRTELWNLRF